ncbi:MAG TPA: ABC transporter ATP-binding protein [Tepidisphaeraceae bacterium]|jgi:branched-chain amino acid transport system ATP-binding protein
MSDLLNIIDLNVHYGSIHALQGISLSVPAGKVVTLIGSNGAGKTTTLRTVSGLLRPSAGRVLFDGQPIHTLAPHKIVGRGVVHAPEGRGVFANLTVDENLKLGAYARRDSAAVKQDYAHALDLFPRLRERLTQMAGTLSGGEQQMLAIARALLARPRLLLLDEPSLGLAPQIVSVIFGIIRKINAEGTTILLVEQNAHMALGVADTAYVLQTGRIINTGPAKDLLNDPQIRAAYLGG